MEKKIHQNDKNTLYQVERTERVNRIQPKPSLGISRKRKRGSRKEMIYDSTGASPLLLEGRVGVLNTKL